jgi:hypothetical protein
MRLNQAGRITHGRKGANTVVQRRAAVGPRGTPCVEDAGHDNAAASVRYSTFPGIWLTCLSSPQSESKAAPIRRLDSEDEWSILKIDGRKRLRHPREIPVLSDVQGVALQNLDPFTVDALGNNDG